MDRGLIRFYGEISSAVMLKLALLVGAYFLGSWLDKRWGCFPLFTFVLITTAGGLGIWWIVRIASRPLQK